MNNSPENQNGHPSKETTKNESSSLIGYWIGAIFFIGSALLFLGIAIAGSVLEFQTLETKNSAVVVVPFLFGLALVSGILGGFILKAAISKKGAK